MSRALLFVLLSMSALVLVSAVGCLGTSPEQQRRADHGKADDGDENHRPGQPCVDCHGEDYHPGDDTFFLAGTIYLRPNDRDGVEGAEIVVTDANGRTFTAFSNSVGNFMVKAGEEKEPGEDEEDRREGKLELSFRPEYPLSVLVRQGGLETIMRSRIWREGSCAGCHALDVAEDSVGRVYVMPEGM